jgi:hypothetical protein
MPQREDLPSTASVETDPPSQPDCDDTVSRTSWLVLGLTERHEHTLANR